MIYALQEIYCYKNNYKKIEYFGLSFQTPLIKTLWLLLPLNFRFWSSYLSMVAHRQILEYWMIMYQIIGDSFEIDTTWSLNILEILLLKWLIYGNDYLTYGAERKSWWYVNVYTNTEKNVTFTTFHCLINKQNILHLFALFLRL